MDVNKQLWKTLEGENSKFAKPVPFKTAQMNLFGDADDVGGEGAGGLVSL